MTATAVMGLETLATRKRCLVQSGSRGDHIGSGASSYGHGAARRFFARAIATTQSAPAEVVTDRARAYLETGTNRGSLSTA
jgi:hypothetical protein